ncbi:hypothetical protein C5167_004019 [Papaver somniferum]|nr:hypothetical protein C5167_004019 [Papaver somniferum]
MKFGCDDHYTAFIPMPGVGGVHMENAGPGVGEAAYMQSASPGVVGAYMQNASPGIVGLISESISARMRVPQEMMTRPRSDCGKHSSVDIAAGKVCICSNMSAENSLRNVGIKSTLNQGYARYCSLLTVMWMIITLTGFYQSS